MFSKDFKKSFPAVNSSPFLSFNTQNNSTARRFMTSLIRGCCPSAASPLSALLPNQTLSAASLLCSSAVTLNILGSYYSWEKHRGISRGQVSLTVAQICPLEIPLSADYRASLGLRLWTCLWEVPYPEGKYIELPSEISFFSDRRLSPEVGHPHAVS